MKEKVGRYHDQFFFNRNISETNFVFIELLPVYIFYIIDYRFDIADL